MSGVQLPETTEPCAGCEEDLNILSPFLSVALKPKVSVLLLDEVEGEGGLLEQSVRLGTRSGRGVLLKFHDFKCLGKWAAKRKDKHPILEPHVEEEIYVPEDNRTPEELVEAGELPKEAARLSALLSEAGDK